MLSIRSEQMDAFILPLRRRFEDRMVARLRKQFTRAAWAEEDEVREETREIIALAESRGIDYESDVERFLFLVYVRWPDARDDEEVRRILASGSLTGAVKVAFVADLLSGPEH